MTWNTHPYKYYNLFTAFTITSFSLVSEKNQVVVLTSSLMSLLAVSHSRHLDKIARTERKMSVWWLTMCNSEGDPSNFRFLDSGPVNAGYQN